MKKELPKFSIIICLYIVNKRFFDDLKKYLDLRYKDFEIILVAEKYTKIGKDKLPPGLPIKIVNSPKERISLGEKRDVGIKVATGDFCAFIDDDAYPQPDWLSNALKIFDSNKKIGAVGGPNLTPPNDPFWAKIGGYIYESYCTSGRAQHRFLPKETRFVAELQGVNLIIRKEILDKIGGFASRLYSGDDSKVCAAIRVQGKKILYDPGVAVYHHRRPFPLAHLKQVKTIGTHRGFFVKAYPETLAPIYFLPTILTIGFFSGLTLSFFSENLRLIFISLFLFFYLLGFSSIIRRAGLLPAAIVAFGIILTHITYGIFFLRGLFTKELLS